MDDDLQRALATQWERRVLRNARVVVHNTERALQVVRAIAPPGSDTIHIAIPNGYDENRPASPPDRDVFRIAFTGWLHPVMDVRVLLDAFSRFRRRHGLTSGQLEICFMGTGPEFGGVPLDGLAAVYELGDVFRLSPRGSREAALALQESSAVLCAMDTRHPLAVPMKFYDYARTCGAMLLIGSQDSALGDAARQLGIPVLEAYDREAIDRLLDDAYERWRAGLMVAPLDARQIFSRRRQAQRMHEILVSVVDEC